MRRTTPPPSACGCRSTPSNRAGLRRSAGRRAFWPPRSACASCGGSQDLPRLEPIAEIAARRTVDLILLMPLAGDEHHIGRGRLVERRGDRRASIVYHAHTARLDAAGDAASDVPRILGAGVIVGYNDLVREFVGNGTHHRPLARVAIAAASEYAPQLAAAMFAQTAQRLGERVRRMRIIDHGQRLAG